MNFKHILLSIAMILLIFTAIGCTDYNSNEKTVKSYENELGVGDVVVGQTYNAEQKLTEQNQKILINAVPPPKLTDSLERRNLVRRYTTLNDDNALFFIYLIDRGVIMGEFTVSGKISSVNSRLTQEEQVIGSSECLTEGYGSGNGYSDKYCYFPVGSPQLDGSYGTNGDGIFFYTTEGAYVEWNGIYMTSNQPLAMSTPPVLYAEVSLE